MSYETTTITCSSGATYSITNIAPNLTYEEKKCLEEKISNDLYDIFKKLPDKV